MIWKILRCGPAAPFAIQGKVVMEVPEGVPAPQPPSVTLAVNGAAAGLADKPGSAFLTGIPDAKGNFQIQNVYPGRYQILTGPAPPQYYLDSIRIGGHDALEPGVEILPGAQPLKLSPTSLAAEPFAAQWRSAPAEQ